ncbi:hypothetical protein [Hymenobacter sp. BRD67]|uniref:hypothetical protein n=1 Tax=Hymenobacter sp. BRD67 TaxID=2675877 RepID=UPI00156766A0|nr:hypothetical protein [Hymenobacter sp. BRD67]QKG51908.1 hypothetical protein GKZ67_03875 [Hymenobacter sp. BRD67]
MKKTLFSALALCLFLAASTQAQTTPTTVTKDGGDKTISKADGMTVKTKVGDDGKMKMKGKDAAGNTMKATTRPRKGDMKMHHKGMKKDSAATKSGASY